MEQIKKVLRYFSLNELEVSLYLASLQVGRGTAYELANTAHIKRPTAYVVARELVTKGLFTAQDEGTKTWYVPTPPRRLVESWKGRVAALEALTPDLNTLYRVGTTKPYVQILEGKAGIDAVYNEIIGVRDTKGDCIRLVSSIATAQKEFGYLVGSWYKAAKDKRNHIQELVNKEDGIAEYIQHIQALGNPHYEIRTTKTDLFGAGDNYIYKNKLAILSLKPDDLFATVIESEDIVKTYKALFDMAWEVAEQVSSGP